MKTICCPYCKRFIKINQVSISDFSYSGFHNTMVGYITCPYTNCMKQMSVHLMFVAYKEMQSSGQQKQKSEGRNK